MSFFEPCTFLPPAFKHLHLTPSTGKKINVACCIEWTLLKCVPPVFCNIFVPSDRLYPSIQHKAK